MKIRKGFLYALLLAIGLLMWTQVADTYQMSKTGVKNTMVSQEVEKNGQRPWTNTEALHACALKARELETVVQSVHYSTDNQQGNLDVVGKKESLQQFYQWLENEGQLQDITSVHFDTVDEQHAKLSVQYHLPAQ